MQKKNFKIDKTLYPDDTISEALKAYLDFPISYDESSSFITIESEDPQFIFDEFMNYALANVNEIRSNL